MTERSSESSSTTRTWIDALLRIGIREAFHAPSTGSAFAARRADIELEDAGLCSAATAPERSTAGRGRSFPADCTISYKSSNVQADGKVEPVGAERILDTKSECVIVRQ